MQPSKGGLSSTYFKGGQRGWWAIIRLLECRARGNRRKETEKRVLSREQNWGCLINKYITIPLKSSTGGAKSPCCFYPKRFEIAMDCISQSPLFQIEGFCLFVCFYGNTPVLLHPGMLVEQITCFWGYMQLDHKKKHSDLRWRISHCPNTMNFELDRTIW